MKEYTTVDKSSWHYGQNEPDKVQYKDEATGLDCLIVRNHHGALCGYVGVFNTHPCYRKNYDEVDVEVHGGLTFSDSCQHGDDPAKGICHIPEPGEHDDVWWLGFDCAHAWDICPVFPSDYLLRDASYKDISYVKCQIKELARQLAELEGEEG